MSLLCSKSHNFTLTDHFQARSEDDTQNTNVYKAFTLLQFYTKVGKETISLIIF